MVLCLSQDGACTDSFENFRENSLKGDLLKDIFLNPPLFSLVNTFKAEKSSFTPDLSSPGYLENIKPSRIRTTTPLADTSRLNNQTLSIFISLTVLKEYTAKTQYLKFEINILRKGIARPQSQFLHSGFRDRFIYSHDRSVYSAAEK